MHLRGAAPGAGSKPRCAASWPTDAWRWQGMLLATAAALLCATSAPGHAGPRAGQGRRLCAPRQRHRPPWACRRGGGTPPGWPCRPSAGWHSPAGSPGCGCGGGGPRRCRWWGPAWRGCPPPAARERRGGATLVGIQAEGLRIAWCAFRLSGVSPSCELDANQRSGGWEAAPLRNALRAARLSRGAGPPSAAPSVNPAAYGALPAQGACSFSPHRQLSCCCLSRHASTAFRARKLLRLPTADARCAESMAGEHPAAFPMLSWPQRCAAAAMRLAGQPRPTPAGGASLCPQRTHDACMRCMRTARQPPLQTL